MRFRRVSSCRRERPAWSRCLAIGFFAGATGCAYSGEVQRAQADQPRKPLYQLNEVELDAHLKALARQRQPTVARVNLFATALIGQPYRLYLLGEYPYELYDADPLYCLSASDCVTFVEHVFAMALSDDWPTFFRTLQRLRYKDGRIGMLTRNHFTEADWNVNNAWAFDDVTARLAPGDSRPMNVVVDRAAFFRKHGIGRDIPIERFETEFVPREAVDRVEPLLEMGDVIEFVRGTPTAPYVGHVGLAGAREAGRLMLIHSREPRVQTLPLLDYVASSPKIIGIKVLRLRREHAE